MQFIRYSNGVLTQWDDTISVGTLIRTYYSGYWILTRIEFREPEPRKPSLHGTMFDVYAIEWSDQEAYGAVPIYHFTQVLKEDGTKSKSIKKDCNASYCWRVTVGEASAMMAAETSSARAKYEAVLNYLEP